MLEWVIAWCASKGYSNSSTIARARFAPTKWEWCGGPRQRFLRRAGGPLSGRGAAGRCARGSPL